LVSTVLPPIVATCSFLPDDCAADAAALGVELLTAVPPPEPEDELPHAATIKAAAANPAAPTICHASHLSVHWSMGPIPQTT
jgi:hypothetical protein